MSGISSVALAPKGSTSNNTHAAVQVDPSVSKIAVEFVVEAIGVTPTVTFKLQGCIVDGAPASTDWQDLILLPAGSETAAVSSVVTTVNRTLNFLAQGNSRFYRQLRLVVSSNTNVTYSANLKQQLHP